jgi:putative addiction module component (TIGR02574 family)
MDTAKKLDKQINDYLVLLNSRQKKAVLTVVEAFAKEQRNDDIWEDDDFIAELDRRTAEYESGKAKVLTRDQFSTQVKAAFKARTKKKR